MKQDTEADLSSAISGTSSNPNAVATMDTALPDDAPSLADMELMRASDELALALRRQVRLFSMFSSYICRLMALRS